MSTAAETAARMVESLPPEAQERVVEKLRELVAEIADEAHWNEQFARKRGSLQAAARVARAAATRGEAAPMDYEVL